MDKLDDVKLQHFLPSSIASDNNVKAISKAADEMLHGVAENTAAILLLPHLDELPEAVIDELAWKYHIDTYNADFDVTIKRELIRQSIGWHRRKGTPAAVTDMLNTIYSTAKLEEFWEYGGKPYHFRVIIGDDRLASQQAVGDIVKTIRLSKNVRSWLDGVKFERNITSRLYVGAAMASSKKVEFFAHTEDVVTTNSLYVAGVVMRNRRQELAMDEIPCPLIIPDTSIKLQIAAATFVVRGVKTNE